MRTNLKKNQGLTGYLHPQYAESLAEFGRPRELPECGGWVLERPIEDVADRDAMGCYPLFACQDWSKLHIDLDNLSGDLVCISLVTDPFGEYDPDYLHTCFSDVVIPFKEHFVIDLDDSPLDSVSQHHRYEARKALRKISVDVHPEPSRFLDQWVDLHENLVLRRNIRGIKAFSKTAFSKQLETPGMVVLLATYEESTVAAMLLFVQNSVVHAHVLGFTELGYQLGAMYALLWRSLEHFRGKARWCNIMGVAGLKNKATDGLYRFKRGWTHQTRLTYFCGRIFDRKRYTEISKARGTLGTEYFPAYRKGEMQ